MQAKDNGKLLLIISGESHYNAIVGDINLRIMHLCQSKFNISDMAIEFDSVDSLMHLPKEHLERLNYKSYYDYAENMKWNIIPVDKYHKSNPRDHTMHRDKGMIEWLLQKLNNHTFYVVGSNHLYGLNNSALKEKFDLLFINTDDNQLKKSKIYPGCSSLDWIIDKNQVIQIYPSAFEDTAEEMENQLGFIE